MQKDDLRSSLNLTDCRIHWDLKFTSQRAGVGSLRWKTLSLRSFHSSQAAMRAASVKKGRLCTLLAVDRRSRRGRLMSQEKLIEFQHCMAKGHSKNKWSISSSMPVLHRTQSTSPWMLKCLLRSIVFVFSLSTRISQAKILILGVQPAFQSTL